MFLVDRTELLNRISVDDIVDMMVNYYGIEMDNDTDPTAYHFKTDCHNEHNEGNFKLYLFKDSKQYHCYSCCGQMSLFDFVMTMEGIEFAEAVEFVQDYFNISSVPRGFGRKERPKKVYEYVKKEIDYNEVLKEYDNGILNTFSTYKPVEWLYEGISPETMERFNILFDMETEGIIIPHYDINDRLIGIRQRNLNKIQLERKRKYVPYTSSRNRVTYKHSLGKNLYGLNINKEKITENKMCVIWESEKSVLKMDSIYGNNPSVCVGGSSISEYQLNLLKVLGCECVYIAFDNELGDDKWEKKMIKIYEKIINFGFKCFVVKDWEQKYLDEKDSPIDKGKEVWRILINQAKEFFKEGDMNDY